MSNHVRSNSGLGTLGIHSKNQSEQSNYGIQGNYSAMQDNKNANQRINQYKSKYEYQTVPNK